MGHVCLAACGHTSSGSSGGNKPERGAELVSASEVQDVQADVEDKPGPYEGLVDDDEEVFPPQAAIEKRGVPEVLARSQVAELQEIAITEVSELLDVPPDDAFALLRAYAWSHDRLSDVFFADPDGVREKVGIQHSHRKLENLESDVCAICFTNAPICLLQCGHASYCEECWSGYVQTAVREGKSCLDLRCPTAQCGERLLLSDARRFCGGEVLDRYDRFRVDSFVDDNPELVWCPGIGCGRAARLTEGCSKSSTVTCLCGLRWCFGCKSDLHLPVQCEVVQDWNKKNKSTSQDATWIVKNTKPCPKCRNPIEKNGGCMHMTCQVAPGGCGYEFCWICLGDWKKHKECNKFSDNPYKTDSKDGESRTELQRYVHYHTRFSEHEKAQAFANTSQRKAIARIASTLHEVQGIPVKDLEFLSNSVDEIVACRRFLKWTYAYAYLMTPSMGASRKQLFEFHQAQLEGTLERLSDITENGPWGQCSATGASSSQKFPELRAQVVSLLDVVRRSFAAVSDGVAASDLAS